MLSMSLAGEGRASVRFVSGRSQLKAPTGMFSMSSSSTFNEGETRAKSAKGLPSVELLRLPRGFVLLATGIRQFHFVFHDDKIYDNESFSLLQSSMLALAPRVTS